MQKIDFFPQFFFSIFDQKKRLFSSILGSSTARSKTQFFSPGGFIAQEKVLVGKTNMFFFVLFFLPKKKYATYKKKCVCIFSPPLSALQKQVCRGLPAGHTHLVGHSLAGCANEVGAHAQVRLFQAHSPSKVGALLGRRGTKPGDAGLK